MYYSPFSSLPSRGHTYKKSSAGEEYGDSSTLRIGESLVGNNNVVGGGGGGSSQHQRHSGHRRTQSGSATEVTEQLADAMASMEVPPAEDVRRRCVD